MKNKVFGRRLRELRTERGWTQSFTANLFGVKQGGYTNWENGTREPKIETLIEIAKIFDVTTDYLLGVTNKNISQNYEKKLYRKIDNLNYELYYNYRIGINQILEVMDELSENFNISEKKKDSILEDVIAFQESYIGNVKEFIITQTTNYKSTDSILDNFTELKNTNK
ncbi:helix-turn-helix domain-containing protein [Streptococcus pluranimalium]